MNSNLKKQRDYMGFFGITESLAAAFIWAKIHDQVDQFNGLLHKAILEAYVYFHDKEALTFDTDRLKKILIQGSEKADIQSLLDGKALIDIKEFALQASVYEFLYLEDESKIHNKALEIIEYVVFVFEKLLLQSPKTSGETLAGFIKIFHGKSQSDHREIRQKLDRLLERESNTRKTGSSVNTTIPYHSLGKNFVGRDESLKKLHSIIIDQQTSIITGVGVVSGTGGLGKTQLAIEYVHRYKAFFPGGIFWVYAEFGRQKMIAEISESVGLPVDGAETEDKQINFLWNHLNSGEKGLIILDNFKETDILKPWLPPSSGNIHTLVTTRRKDLTSYPSIELNFLDKEDGIKLLNSGKRKIGEEAGELVELLGGLPLALELARHYLNVRNDVSIPHLIEDIKLTGEIVALNSFSETYKQELPSEHSKEIIATFQLSWDLVSEEGKQILKILSLLAPTPFPVRIIRKILNREETISFKDPLLKTIHEELFNKLSIIELGDRNSPYLHRLIKGFVQTKEVEIEIQESVINAVQKEMFRINDDFDTTAYLELNEIVFHADHVSSNIDDTDQKNSILNNIATFYHKKGFCQNSKKYYALALIVAQKCHEPAHPDIVKGQTNLALVLQDLGELAEAKVLLGSALVSAQKNDEPNHSNIPIIQSNLANVLKDLGEFADAKKLLKSALTFTQKNYAPGHPSIAIIQSNLANVLITLGELADAKNLFKRTLAYNQEIYEPGHPFIAIGQSNHAMMLIDLGELEDAKVLLESALASDQKSYEPGHPSIALIQSNLALVLKDLGELEEAKNLLESALVSDQKSYELGHPSIARSQSNLATVLRSLGELEDAKVLLKSVLASDQKSYEPGHPSIAIIQSNLATVLHDLGELEEACLLWNESYGAFKKTLGNDHKKTKISKKNLDTYCLN